MTSTVRPLTSLRLVVDTNSQPTCPSGFKIRSISAVSNSTRAQEPLVFKLTVLYSQLVGWLLVCIFKGQVVLLALDLVDFYTAKVAEFSIVVFTRLTLPAHHDQLLRIIEEHLSDPIPRLDGSHPFTGCKIE